MNKSVSPPDALPPSEAPVEVMSSNPASTSSRPDAGSPPPKASIEVRLETEPPSFESIYRASLPFVRRRLWWLGVERCDLDDMTQEVFLVVYRRLPSYDPRFSVNAWLGGITWRVACNHHGRLRKRGEEALPEEGEGPAFTSPEISAEQAAARSERSIRLRGMVQRLEPDLRVIFVMHEIEGISMHEIADALGIPHGTAWSRQRRAVAEFNAALKRLNARMPGALDVSFGLLPWGFALDLPTLDPETRVMDTLWTRLQASLAERKAVEAEAEDWDPPTQKDAIAASVQAAAGRAGKDLLLAKMKLVAAGTGLVLGGAGAGILADRALHPRSVPVEAALLEVERPATPLVSAAAPPLAPTLPAATSVPGPTAPVERAAAAPAAQPEPESMLFRRAKKAFDDGRATEAIELLQRHARRSPHGPDAERREVLLCRALFAAGRRAEAVLQAERLRAAFPRSASLAMIEAMLRAP